MPLSPFAIRAGLVSRYREASPRDRRLAGIVDCTWIGDGGWSRTLRLLPDGRADLTWDGERLHVVAPRAAAIRVPVGPSRPNVGLRLRCGSAGLLGDADDVHARDVARRLLRLNDPAEQIAALESYVAARLADGLEPDPLTARAVQELARPEATVEAVAVRLDVGERELRRRFAAQAGLAPKAMQRVLRFAGVIRGLPEVAQGRLGFAGLSADLGYADQAHMVRECVRISGASPARLLRAWRRNVQEGGVGAAR